MSYQFFTGTSIGFLIASSVIPIAIICIRRTFVDGFLTGIISGIGAALGTALFSSLSAFQLNSIIYFFSSYALILKFIAGVYLLYLGLRAYFSTRFIQQKTYFGLSWTHAFYSTLFLALANPITISSFPFWFTAYQVDTSSLSFFESIGLTIGVFCGSTIWWLALTFTSIILAKRCSENRLKQINQVSSILIGISGLISIIALFISW